MNPGCVVCLDHVWTCFGGEIIHRDISLALRRGEIMGLVGASGSGKTVLMREMIGLLRPDRGRISILGQSLWESGEKVRRQLRARWGVLFQGGALFSTLSVFENIAFPLRELRGLDEALIERLVCMKLAMTGLESGDAMRMPAELSGGMVKRAALARALIMEPELLFLDEPTSGLDPPAGESFVDLVEELHRELGFTVLMITHDLDTLRDLCTRVAVLADQRLIALGTLDEVRECPHPFAREYFHGKRARRFFGRRD